MQNNISQVCQLKLSARCATWLFVFKVKTETTFVKGHAKLECAILKMPDDQFGWTILKNFRKIIILKKMCTNVTNMRQAGLPLIRPWLVNYHFEIEQQSPQDGFPLDGVLGDNSHETQAVATTLNFKTIFKFKEKRVGLLICHKCKTQQVNWLSSNTGLRVFWTYK